jgi:hypothetical protein
VREGERREREKRKKEWKIFCEGNILTYRHGNRLAQRHTDRERERKKTIQRINQEGIKD